MEKQPSVLTLKIERQLGDNELVEILNAAFRPEMEILQSLHLINRKLDRLLENQVTEHDLAELTYKAIRVAAHMTALVDRLQQLTK